MGDTENEFQPSKKRAAGRELCRDNPGLDDEEDDLEQETGTFKKASEDVLANRRIVKVRRNRPSSAPSAPSSNPFAAIQLVPPTVSPAATPATVTNVEESRDKVEKETKKEEGDGGNVEAKRKVDEVEKHEVASESEKPESLEKHEVASEAEKPESADAESAKEETECEAKKETEGDEPENDEKKNTEFASVSSFQQLSSTQNAFTGLVGTGFSSSTFSFGSITKGDQPSFPSFNFATNGNSSLNKTEGTKTPSMQQVEVETGEENEKAVFTADSVMFEFLDGGWKERGKGELKVNVSTTGSQKGRLVMRARGNYRLILNASLYPDMKLTNMDKKGITFACINSAGEGKDSLSTFALKFKDPSIVDEFRSMVTQHKGSNSAVASLKTPENSPKASDE